MIGVGQVGEQREVNVGVVIAEEPDFEIFDQAVHLLFVQQQGGHRDQRQAIGWECPSRNQAWEESPPGSTSVMMLSMIWIAHCELGKQEQQHRKQDQPRRTVARGDEQQNRGNDRRASGWQCR